MSFTDRPHQLLSKLGCFLLGTCLLIVNFFVFALWYFSFWDPSTDTYRSVAVLDFVIVPGVFVGSILLLRFYFKTFM